MDCFIVVEAILGMINLPRFQNVWFRIINFCYQSAYNCELTEINDTFRVSLYLSSLYFFDTNDVKWNINISIRDWLPICTQ